MRFASKFACFLLERADLSLEDRNLLTSKILDKLEALPIRDILTIGDSGEILISGRPLDFEKARQLRESARAALTNSALLLLQNQILYLAVQRGLHQGDTPEKLYFYRAAIWFGLQLEDMLKNLAQVGEQEPGLTQD